MPSSENVKIATQNSNSQRRYMFNGYLSNPSKLLRYRSIITLCDQLIVSAGNFITIVLTANYLGIEFFGWYSLILLPVSLAMSIQLGLIVSPMMSITPKEPENKRIEYLSIIFTHAILYCLLASGFIYLFTTLLLKSSGLPAMVTVISALAGLFYLFQDFMRRFLFAKGKVITVFVSDIINQVLKNSILLILLKKSESNISSALWNISGSAALAIIFTLPFVGAFRFRISEYFPVSRRQWRSARWLICTGMMQWVTGNSALITIGTILGPVSAGALRAVQTILSVLNIARESLENILPQYISSVYANKGFIGLNKEIRQLVILVVSVSSLVSILLILSGSHVIYIVYGDKFVKFDYLIWILAPTFPVSMGIFILNCSFRAIEKTEPVFISSVVGATINLILIYPAVIAFGPTGAAVVIIVVDLSILSTLVIKYERVVMRYYFLEYNSLNAIALTS